MQDLVLPAAEIHDPNMFEAPRLSESRYRRLFEAAKDGILLLNAETARIEDVNPCLVHMLGYLHAEFLGKKLWEARPFADIAESQGMFAELQDKGYVRYDLSLRTKAGALIDVELVGNTYDCQGTKVIQCNIRDITLRKAAERELHASKAHLHQLTIFLQRAREADRAQFARELHDELGQTLTVLRIEFNALADRLATVDPAIRSRLAGIDKLINSTTDATRLICEELRPGMLDAFGFEVAIASHVRNFTHQFGIPCDLLLDSENFGLDDLLATAIFRIVQEALTNIARHAHACHAMVALKDGGEELLLTIADDGCGMATGMSGERKTYGILGMRERVDIIGGRIAIDSTPGRGTHIEVSIPKSPQPNP